MIKRFLEWIGLKEKIHSKSSGPLYYKEGEIWWCAVQENLSRAWTPLCVYDKLAVKQLKIAGKQAKTVGKGVIRGSIRLSQFRIFHPLFTSPNPSL